MNLEFNIEKSLEAKPPNYGLGITHLRRTPLELDELVDVDDEGCTLQPRDKELDEGRSALKESFRKFGVLYDREVMVVEERADGMLELQSGFNRKYQLMEMGVETYFGDVITYDNNYFKACWKRKFNATFTDHLAKGIPNTKASYLKGLKEAVAFDSFEWKDDNKVLDALDFMSNGSLSEDDKNKILQKFRKTLSVTPDIVALDTKMANDVLESLGLPHSGYVKKFNKKSFGRIGFARWDGDSMSKLCQWIQLYDRYKEIIEIYGFIEHIDSGRYLEQRKIWKKKFDETITWMRNHFDPMYHDVIQFKGFIAQISTKNPKDGGKRLERGIVDINGNIIIDTHNKK